MNEEDYNREYVIPANFTDSGGVMNGKFQTRNAVEAGIVLLGIGYPIAFLLPFSLIVKCILCVVIVMPLVIFALIGIDGDSFTQYVARVIRYRKNKRHIHLRRFGYHYDKTKNTSKPIKSTERREENNESKETE